jgi:signal transduction histidine kinase
MSNAIRHGKAKHTTVTLSRDGDNVVLKISDNGTGFKADANLLSGIGLQTMRYRAQLIGATLHVRSKVGGGSTVECVLPHPLTTCIPANNSDPVIQPS